MACPYINNPKPSQPYMEGIWIEMSTQHKKVLLCTFYPSPNFPSNTLVTIENSIGLAFDTNIEDILITGDFNLDVPKPNTFNKIRNLCQNYGLEKLQLVHDLLHLQSTYFNI